MYEFACLELCGSEVINTYDSCCGVIQKWTGRVRSRSFISGSDRAKVVCGALCLVRFIYIVCIMSW